MTAEARSATVVDVRLGQRIRARRLEIGMSQEQLAAALNITFQQVQKYEKGVNRIAASRLVQIATALDISVTRLFEGLGPGRNKSDAGRSEFDDVLSTAEGSELIALFATIKSKKTRRRVVELVRALSQDR